MKYQESRRKFITYTIASTSLLLAPNIATANQYKNIVYLTRLHPVRFVAGLIFDIIRSVFVELAADTIVSALYKGQRPKGIILGNSNGMENMSEFRHANYKASAVILGVSDYEVHKKNKLRILLSNLTQEEKFNNVVAYLRDENIRIKTSGMEYSNLIGYDVEPDDLFALDYFQFPSHKERHYKNIIKISDSDTFKNWSI